MNNIKIDFQEGLNKKGKKYAFIVFKVLTSSGVYNSSPVFPSPLEFSILKKEFSTNKEVSDSNADSSVIGSIYSNSDTSLDSEF